MFKYLKPLSQGILVQATSNLLDGIRPIITSTQTAFLGQKRSDPGCNDSSRPGDSNFALQTWAFNLESPAEINTVSIFFKEKPERPQKFEVKVGYSSDISQNPLCALSDTLTANNTESTWLRCGLKGNLMSVTFCGDDEELEIRAYSLHGIKLRKIVSTTTQFDKDNNSITWVSQSGLPSNPENVVEGNILKFSSSILISYVKMADVSQSQVISVADTQNKLYPCEPVLSEVAYKEMICALRGDGLIFDLTSYDLPDSMLVLTLRDPSTIKFETNLLEQFNNNKLRQLAVACTGCGNCLNPTGLLNLLNTGVIVNQSSYYSTASQIPQTPCDGFVLEINTSTLAVNRRTVAIQGNNALGTGPALPGYWMATFSVITTIKTVLIMNEDIYPGNIRAWMATFGTDPDITLNPVFIALGYMTAGGWYMSTSPMTGTIFGIIAKTNYFNFREVMLYSQEAIQINALSAIATNVNLSFPATNALQNIVVLLATAPTQKCVVATAPTTGLAKVDINLKAYGFINGVTLLPGYFTVSSDWPTTQTNVAISGNIVGNTNQLCGSMADYYSRYSEVFCNIVANQIIIEQQTVGSDVRLCGVGILSNCDCAQSQFDPTSFTTAPTTALVSTNLISKFIGDISGKSVLIISSIPDTVSTICGNGDGSTKCGLRTIKFYDSSNVEIIFWPYLGITWDPAVSTITLPGAYQVIGSFTIDVEISLSSNASVKYRQTITVAVNNYYCSNPIGMLNLLNTGVIVNQSSYYPGYSQTAVTPCDGFVLEINTSTFADDYLKIAAPSSVGPLEFWKATFPAATSIKSSVIIDRNDCCKWRPLTWTMTFGTSQDITQNPVCIAVGTMTDGGWYMCPQSMTGTVFGIQSTTDFFDFVEVMLFSQEAIQMNALSAVANAVHSGFPATNALQNIVVLLTTASTQKCVVATLPTTGLAKVEINLKAFGFINGVTLLPGYMTVSSVLPAVQANIAISVNMVGNTKKLCGIMTDYYSSYSDVSCNIVANQIIFEQQTAGRVLLLCGVGILSDCDCAQSQFDPMLIPSAVTTSFASVTKLSLLSSDQIQTIKFNPLMPDTISSICGTADGITKCGLRQIIFADKSTGQAISLWPYQGYDWNPVSNTLTVKPGSAIAKSVLTATLSLVSQPKVIYSQEITVSVAIAPLIKASTPLYVANQSLSAIINQEAILQLPDFGVNSSYALISTQTYSVILEGTKLTVLSQNLADVGTQQLTMSLQIKNQTVNFQVNVIFTENQTDKTAVQGSAQQVAPTAVYFQPTVTSKKNQEILVIALPLIRPQIKLISNMALVNITFNGNISANITEEQIRVRYIQNSNEIDLTKTFKWNITEVNTTWAENFMLIQLNFTQPILVSQGNKPDMIEVLYRNDYLYPLGKVAPSDDLNFTTMTTFLPMLAPSAKQAEMINTISTIAADAASNSFWTFLAAYLVLSTVMKYVWQTFNTLQILLVFPMLLVKMPVNVTNVQDSFKNIVNLDFIDKKKVYKSICEPLFGEIIESIKNPDTDTSSDLLAERSKSLVIQITFMVVFCVVISALMVGIVLIRICAKKIKNKTILNVYKSLEAKVMFSSILRYGIQQYLQLSLTTLIAFNNFAEVAPILGRQLESAEVVKPDIKKIVITTLLTFFLIFYPLFCVWFLRRYEIILYMEAMKMRFGTMYVGLNYYKRSSLVYLTIFLLRRLVFAVIVVNATQNVQLQLLLSMYCSMFMLYYLIVYTPMWDLALNLIFLFNEGCLFICSTLMFLFTDYVPMPEDRYTLGWFYLGVVGFNIVGNGVFVFYDIQVQIKQRIFYKKEKERKIKQRLMRKEEEKKVFKMVKVDEQQLAELGWSNESQIEPANAGRNKSQILEQERQWLEQEQQCVEQENQNMAQLDQLWFEQERQRMKEEESKIAEQERQNKIKQLKLAIEQEKNMIEQEQRIKQQEKLRMEYQRKRAEQEKLLMEEKERQRKIQQFELEIEQEKRRIEQKQRKQQMQVMNQYISDIENGTSAVKHTKIDGGEGWDLYVVEEEANKVYPRSNFDLEISRDYEQIMAQDQKQKNIAAKNQVYQRQLMANQDLETSSAVAGEVNSWEQILKANKVKSTKPKEPYKEPPIAREELIRVRDELFPKQASQDRMNIIAKKTNSIKPKEPEPPVTREEILRVRDELFPPRMRILKDDQTPDLRF